MGFETGLPKADLVCSGRVLLNEFDAFEDDLVKCCWLFCMMYENYSNVYVLLLLLSNHCLNGKLWYLQHNCAGRYHSVYLKTAKCPLIILHIVDVIFHDIHIDENALSCEIFSPF